MALLTKVLEQQPSGLVDSAALDTIRDSGRKKKVWMLGRRPVASTTCEPA